MQELVSELSDNYAGIKNKTLALKDAKELANMAGKIINGCKTQVMYNAFMGVKEPIPFLKPDTKSGGTP